MEVDAPRKRIGLSMKSDPDYEGAQDRREQRSQPGSARHNSQDRNQPRRQGGNKDRNRGAAGPTSAGDAGGGAMAAALKAAMERRK